MPLTQKRILNDIPRVIDDALMGVVLSNKGVVLLQDKRIVLRRDYQAMNGIVKLVGGGGGGHEPSPAGYVGPGMLTAAVLGDILTSPPTNIVLKAIQEVGVGYEDGVLIIVANLLGNCLNFGLAVERAKSEGIYVKMLVIGDDCSLKVPSKVTGRRGLVGVILVMKIAGAMAEEGRSLDDIFTTCQTMLGDIATLGFNTQTAPVPGTAMKSQLGSHEISLGVGLNSGPGAEVIPMCSAREIAATVLNYIKQHCCVGSIMDPTKQLVVLINNMGGTSKLEELVFVKEILSQLSSQGYTVARSYCSSFVSSLDTRGFSVTIMKLSTADLLPYLDAPTAAVAWPKVMTAECVGMKEAELPASQATRLPPGRDLEINLACEMIGPEMDEMDLRSLLTIIRFVAAALISVEHMLNYHDGEGGDGLFGTSLKRGAMAVVDAIASDKFCKCRPYKLLQMLSSLVEDSMGGIAGALYGIFFASAANSLSNMPSSTVMGPAVWIGCFQRGIEGIETYGQAKYGDGTMLDSLVAARTVLVDAMMKEDADMRGALERAAVAAEVAARDTVEKSGPVGRSSYLPSTIFREPDPGAHCVAVWMRAVYEAVKVVMTGE